MADDRIQVILNKLRTLVNATESKQDELIAGNGIDIINNVIKTKSSQFITVDCTNLSQYTITDNKIYILTNVSAISIDVSGNDERHFFVICGSNPENIVVPSTWEIEFSANKTIEISVLDGKAVGKEWTISEEG